MQAPGKFMRRLGPGLITGAADDDPSGIATYSQAGAQFGNGMLWTVVFTFPLMTAIQLVSARIGLVTGRDLAANLREHSSRPVLIGCVGLLIFANIVNIAADIAAMGQASSLVFGGHAHLYAVAFGLVSLGLQIFLPYTRYVRWLKWLTLSLFAYVAVLLVVKVDWLEVAAAVAWPWPRVQWNHDALVMVVAVLGTTISPYLFFWQAAQEAEGRKVTDEAELRGELQRVRTDTFLGMAFSNLIAFCIILATAVTLHAAGKTDIQSAAQAAQALRPIAGELAFLLFAFGIIGTGLLAVPVLAGSAAYAVAGTFGKQASLDLKLQRGEGKFFYAVISIATLGGIALCFTSIDPMKALVWAAVVNGVTAVPIMAVLMRMATRKDVMGTHAIGRRVCWFGWLATAVMAIAALLMVVTY